MKEYSNEIKWEMVTALRNCKDASLIKALIQKHGPELASAHLFCEKDPIGGNMTALHYLVMCAPDVTETVKALKLLVATKGVNINACESWDRTPLFYASANRKFNLSWELMRYGATVGKKEISICCWDMGNCCWDMGQSRIKDQLLSILNNPPRTYKQEAIDKKNLLAMILHKRVNLGTMDDILQMLCDLGY